MTVGSLLRYVERNIEKFIIIISYGSMAGIIFVEVIRRFLFNQQAPWSTTIPIYLFFVVDVDGRLLQYHASLAFKIFRV